MCYPELVSSPVPQSDAPILVCPAQLREDQPAAIGGSQIGRTQPSQPQQEQHCCQQQGAETCLRFERSLFHRSKQLKIAAASNPGSVGSCSTAIRAPIRAVGIQQPQPACQDECPAQCWLSRPTAEVPEAWGHGSLPWCFTQEVLASGTAAVLPGQPSPLLLSGSARPAACWLLAWLAGNVWATCSQSHPVWSHLPGNALVVHWLCPYSLVCLSVPGAWFHAI